MKKIMLMARDPGGANVILALVKTLAARRYEVRLLGKDMALDRYKAFGLEAEDISKFMSLDSDLGMNMLGFIQQERPDFIISGTSVDDFTERCLWQGAAQLGIPCFCIIDQWINYGLRFSPYTLSQLEAYQRKPEHPYLPDRILVMDDEARDAMLAAGFDEERVLTSGQPYFDLLLNNMPAWSEGQINHLRSELLLERDEYLAVYISEPISQTGNYGGILGYDEKITLKYLRQAMSRVGQRHKRRVTICVLPHPKETIDGYEDLFLENSNDMLNLRLNRHEPGDIIRAADLVCGMSSMLFIEAVLLGCPGVSIQIGLRGSSPLVLEQKGWLQSVRDPEKLEEVLESTMKAGKTICGQTSFLSGGIEKAIKYMEEYYAAFSC